MKRIYIAIAFILFSLIVGLVELITINTNVDNYIHYISQTEELVKDNKIEKAEKLIKNTSKKFERISKSILYCYYRHDELEEITAKLYSIEDLLDDKRIEDYHETSHSLKEKLLSIKEKEQITIQNIL